MERDQGSKRGHSERGFYPIRKFNVGDVVYMISDEEMAPMVVTGLLYRQRDLLYVVKDIEREISVYEFEIARKK
jgi:hypothetical protein